jgi:ketosteroid isomerase-like protein
MNIQQIQTLENRLTEAMKTSNVEELDALIADDLIFTSHTGVIFTKQDDLDAHRSGNIEIFDVIASEQKIRIEGNVAIVSVLLEISGSFFGNTEVGFFRFTRIWKDHGDKWQVIAAQSTQVIS